MHGIVDRRKVVVCRCFQSDELHASTQACPCLTRSDYYCHSSDDDTVPSETVCETVMRLLHLKRNAEVKASATCVFDPITINVAEKQVIIIIIIIIILFV